METILFFGTCNDSYDADCLTVDVSVASPRSSSADGGRYGGVVKQPRVTKLSDDACLTDDVSVPTVAPVLSCGVWGGLARLWKGLFWRAASLSLERSSAAPVLT